jgi:hypothetical protein
VIATPHPEDRFAERRPEATSLGSRRGISILLLLSLVQFTDILDASILNIALPSIKHDRHGTRPRRRLVSDTVAE